MCRVRLIHWNADKAKERAERLRAAGYDVAYEQLDAAGLRQLREDPPSAVVIDLSRLPSQGRDMGVNLRTYGATRHVPLVFVEGDTKKVARVQELLPDAIYTSWDEIANSLEQAIAHPPEAPVVPDSLMAGYAGTPLPKKLGIKSNSVVALVGAPERFKQILGQLPAGAVLREGAQGQCDVTVWFTRSREELERDIERITDQADQGPVWIAWPKKASRMVTDLSQQHVRDVGLASGLVDYKICSIDENWSGLLFTRRP
jgi:CheY-like chemotaxis protein